MAEKTRFPMAVNTIRCAGGSACISVLKGYCESPDRGKRQSLVVRERDEGVPEATQPGRSGVWDGNGCKKAGSKGNWGYMGLRSRGKTPIPANTPGKKHSSGGVS